MWFPSYKWNPGTAEPNQLLTYQTSGKGSIASVLMKKKKKRQFCAYDFGLIRCCPSAGHHAIADASCLLEATGKARWELPTILLAKLVRKLPMRQKCFEISCFGYERDFIGWVFWRRGKRDGMSIAVTCVGLQPSDWSCGGGCWHSWPALTWKGLSLSLLLSVRQSINQT